MRPWTTLVLSLASFAAYGQLDQARALLGPAYAELAYRPGVRLKISGTENWRGRPKQLDIEAVFRFTSTNDRGIAELDLQSFVDGNLVERYAGDGANLWHYDAATHSYWSANYGTAEGTQTPGYLRRLMQMLSSTSTGHLKFLARLMFDTLGATGTSSRIADLWNPWLPNATVTVEGSKISTEVGNPKSLQIDYTTLSDESGIKLSSINYWSYDVRAGMTHEIAWTLLVLPIPSSLTSERFKFIPPRNAKVIAQPFRATGIQ